MYISIYLHLYLYFICAVCAVLSHSVMSDSLQPRGFCSPPGSSVQGGSPDKNTEVGYHALLQGILSTQGSNPGLPHCKRILYHLSHKGSLIFYLYLSKSSFSEPDSAKLAPTKGNGLIYALYQFYSFNTLCCHLL